MLSDNDVLQVIEAIRRNPDLISNIHDLSDVDFSSASIHHSLGQLPNQASPGNHNHGGKTSKVLAGYINAEHYITFDKSGDFDHKPQIQQLLDNITLRNGKRGSPLLLWPSLGFPITIKSPYTTWAGIRHKGASPNLDSSHNGTEFQAMPGFVGTDMVLTEGGYIGSVWQHWSSMEDMSFDGNNVAAITNALIHWGQPGENSYLRNIKVRRTPAAGIRVGGGGAYGFLDGINAIACGAGINLSPLAGDGTLPGFMWTINRFSGDNNGVMLYVHGAGLSTQIILDGFKVESGSGVGNDRGVGTALQNDAIILDACEGAILVVHGGIVISDDAVPRRSVVRITTNTGNRPQVILEGVYPQGYTNMISDATAGGVTVPALGAGGIAGQKSTVHYNVKPLVVGPIGALVLAEGSNIQSTDSTGTPRNVLSVGTNDRVQLQSLGQGAELLDHNGNVIVRAGAGGANALGFYGSAGVIRPAAYTLNAGTTSRNLPAGGTVAQVEAVLRQLLADLQANGLAQ